mmetsp:Transcript_37556/g.103153  ORF Transcript_37556/g.103153 Transcript_37556/m.103153 type:complete len:219 (+) Transcript_37556:259-915(+)
MSKSCGGKSLSSMRNTPRRKARPRLMNVVAWSSKHCFGRVRASTTRNIPRTLRGRLQRKATFSVFMIFSITSGAWKTGMRRWKLWHGTTRSEPMTWSTTFPRQGSRPKRMPSAVPSSRPTAGKRLRTPRFSASCCKTRSSNGSSRRPPLSMQVRRRAPSATSRSPKSFVSDSRKHKATTMPWRPWPKTPQRATRSSRKAFAPRRNNPLYKLDLPRGQR